MYDQKYEKDGWDILNFLDVEERVRRNLTDGDLAGIFVCIDGVNNIKILRLPSCISLIGHGLMALRGSMKLKILDLGLMSVDHEGTKADLLGENSDISADAIIPLLNSIVSMENNSLKRMHLPKSWITDPNSNDQMADILLNHINNSHLHNRRSRVGCRGCDDHFRQSTGGSICIGIEKGDTLKSCPDSNCDYKYCDWCLSHLVWPRCSKCNKTKCEGCSELWYCDDCDKEFCGECAHGTNADGTEAEEGRFVFYCGYGCDGKSCADCMRQGKANTRKCIRCENENYAFCYECVEMQYSPQDEGYICEDCLQL